ncbi:MAG: Ig-like domain-containing protein [Gemmatimonadaceae bacterium]
MSPYAAVRSSFASLRVWKALALATMLAACSSSGSTGPQVATSLRKVSGDLQMGAAGSDLTNPLVVQVKDQSGQPMAGVTVTWAVTAGGGSVSRSSTVTDATGVAQVTWTLGSSLGSGAVTAIAAGLPPVTFTATQTAGGIAAIAVVSGDNQSAVAGTALAAPLVAKVTDGGGNPVSGATVTFVSSNGGSFGSATATTNAAGQAQTIFTAGTGAGTTLVTATAGASGPSAIFTVNVTPAAASQIVKVSGDNQTAAKGTSLPAAFVVKVTDQYGNTISGKTVTWTTTGGTLSAASTTTDVKGEARSTLTLPSTTGAQTVTARVTGLTDVTFTATGT